MKIITLIKEMFAHKIEQKNDRKVGSFLALLLSKNMATKFLKKNI
jgi:hypothetical protein